MPCLKDPLFDEKFYLMVESDPQTYEDAAHDQIWKTAMKKEFSSLQKNNTWELVDLPLGRKLVQCKWVFKSKFVFDGLPLKYKKYWYPRATHKYMVLTTMKPLHQWKRWTP